MSTQLCINEYKNSQVVGTLYAGDVSIEVYTDGTAMIEVSSADNREYLYDYVNLAELVDGITRLQNEREKRLGEQVKDQAVNALQYRFENTASDPDLNFTAP